jgi:ATP phosphoribosyltransferase
LALLAWPVEQNPVAETATEAFLRRNASRRANGLLAERGDLFDIAGALAAAGVGPVSVTRPEFAFEPYSEAADALERRLKLQN